MTTLKIIETDNQGPHSTMLVLQDEKFVEVDPIELFINMLENNFDDTGLSQDDYNKQMNKIESLVNNFVDLILK